MAYLLFLEIADGADERRAISVLVPAIFTVTLAPSTVLPREKMHPRKETGETTQVIKAKTLRLG